MRSALLGRSGSWLLAGIGVIILLLMMFIGFLFFNKLQKSKLSIHQDFLVKQSEFSANELEREFDTFKKDVKDFSAVMDSLNWVKGKDNELLTSEVKRVLDSYPDLIDTLWINFGDYTSFFTRTPNNEFFKGNQFESPPFYGGFNLEFGKINGVMASYWLNIQKFSRQVLPDIFGDSRVGQFLVSDSQLIDVTKSPSMKILSSSDWKQTLNDSYLGTTGFYQVKWLEDDKEISGYLVHTPVNFGRLGFPTGLISLVPLDALNTADNSGLIYLALAFGLVFFGLLVGLMISIKTNLAYSKTKESAKLEIKSLLEQQNIVLKELQGFVFFHNANLEIQKVSNEFEHLLGLSGERLTLELQGQPKHSLMVKIKQELSRAVNEKKPFIDFEFDFFQEKEHPKKIRIFEKLIYDQFGLFTHGIGICKDITEQHKSQMEIIQSENRLRALINNLPDIIFIFDNEGRVMDIHLQEKEHLLKTALTNLGKKLEEFIPDSNLQEILSAFKKARQSGKIQTTNMPWQDEFEGLKYYEIRFFPLDQNQMISIAKDVTSQKIWENGLREAMHDAEIANKAKSEFLANMSHEIRTPMNCLMGIIDLLERTNLDKMQIQYVDIIKNSGNSLLTILRDILDYSRIESGKIEIQNSPFNPVEQVKAQIAALHKIAKKKKLTIDFTYSDQQEMLLEGDKDKINQILINLISNALKFTPEGGRVGISLEFEEINNQLGYLRYEVSDTGIGISEENREYLFKPFYQVESSNTKAYQGLGLGLAIVKKVVELLGGELTFKSQLGKGAVFSFTVLIKYVSDFPLVPVAPYIAQRADDQHATLFPLRILLAEDNDLNLQLMTMMFKQLGFEFELARNGQEVIKMVKEREFDLVLMDVQMPIMNGLEAAKQIRSLPGMDDLVIIGLSANVFQEDEKKALASGMNDYLTKPLRLSVLADKLEYYFRKVKNDQ